MPHARDEQLLLQAPAAGLRQGCTSPALVPKELPSATFQGMTHDARVVCVVSAVGGKLVEVLAA